MAAINMLVVLTSCLHLALLGHAVSATETHIHCDGQAFSDTFEAIFNLKLVINGGDVAIIENDAAPTQIPNSKMSLKDLFGTLNSESVLLNVTVDISCNPGDLPTIKCVLFGLPRAEAEYKNFSFPPYVKVDGETRSVSKIPFKKTYSPEEMIIMSCEAPSVSNSSSWVWQYRRLDEDAYIDVPLKTVQFRTPIHEGCFYKLRSSIFYESQDLGDISIRCLLETKEISSVILRIGNFGEDLRTHLMLSSVLVYIHFIIVPSLWTWCTCPSCLGEFRKPENKIMKTIRTGISMVIGIAFLIWWSILYSKYGDTEEFPSFMVFFITAQIFVMSYAYIRFATTIPCLEKSRKLVAEGIRAATSCSRTSSKVQSTKEEEAKIAQPEPPSTDGVISSSEDVKKGKNIISVGDFRMYNARVVISYGAVLNPIICWLMIKVQSKSALQETEVVLLVGALTLLLAFVWVSYDREGKTWETKQ